MRRIAVGTPKNLTIIKSDMHFLSVLSHSVPVSLFSYLSYFMYQNNAVIKKKVRIDNIFNYLQSNKFTQKITGRSKKPVQDHKAS